MKLLEVAQDTVVRNVGNGSHYRFERPEESRARIRPLELFPSGLLIPKPTDTTVAGEIEVEPIGGWHEGMVVEGKPDHSRRYYETELVKRTAELLELEVSYAALPVNGTGKLSRGSWANKLKNCRYRIEVLQLGLEFVTTEVTVEHAVSHNDAVKWSPKQVVQLPSGQPALVLGSKRSHGSVFVDVRTKLRGVLVTTNVPAEALTPWSQARLCSR